MGASGPGPSIVLIGFMGAGKSTAARALALALGEPCHDTDDLIERREGRPIERIFAEDGEARFREIEEEVVLEALDRGGVAALGGGALGSARTREALAGHLVVLCDVDEEAAWDRCAGSNRPLANDRAEFRRRYAERAPLYTAVARAYLPTGGAEAGALAGPWLARLRDLPDVMFAWARTASGHYPVVVGPGATQVLPDDVTALGSRRFAVADRAALAAVGSLLPPVEAEPIEVEGGEESKKLSEAERVLAGLAAAGVRRDDAVLAFGGGVIGDLAGFCAAVYQRGIPVIQVPTTLVAQVDSAIGGKTGVDLPSAKNYVGAYHQPSAVLADPRALETLPQEELAAGFAEVVKTALIAGGELWERARSIDAVTPQAVAPLVFDCARTKIGIVAADERDAGRRAVLNFGHTVGHAIEAAAGFGRMRHGEAVALGLLAALRLSDAVELRAEVEALLERAALPTRLDGDLEVDEVLRLVGLDKKRTAHGVGFVLLREPGHLEHGNEVDPDSLRAAVEELRES